MAEKKCVCKEEEQKKGGKGKFFLGAAIGAIAGSSLEQTTWLRRNLEVKPSPKIMVDGTNLESDVEGIDPPTLKFVFVGICPLVAQL